MPQKRPRWVSRRASRRTRPLGLAIAVLDRAGAVEDRRARAAGDSAEHVTLAKNAVQAEQATVGGELDLGAREQDAEERVVGEVGALDRTVGMEVNAGESA